LKREIIPYNPKLKKTATHLRKTMTLNEILLWEQLKGKKILGYDFHRQKPIDNYVVDFFCPKLKLAVEIDGESHTDNQEKDEKRQKKIESYGITFLRFSSLDIMTNLEGVCESIKGWIEENVK
jgi:very-short-patch-repair endonuclease